MCVCMIICFFFKQKTAYEMRISDWSSDVCSSDLMFLICTYSNRAPSTAQSLQNAANCFQPIRTPESVDNAFSTIDWTHRNKRQTRPAQRRSTKQSCQSTIGVSYPWRMCLVRPSDRSEEHTSELQSLMRISYAVFCLKKKNSTHTSHT